MKSIFYVFAIMTLASAAQAGFQIQNSCSGATKNKMYTTSFDVKGLVENSQVFSGSLQLKAQTDAGEVVINAPSAQGRWMTSGGLKQLAILAYRNVANQWVISDTMDPNNPDLSLTQKYTFATIAVNNRNSSSFTLNSKDGEDSLEFAVDCK